MVNEENGKKPKGGRNFSVKQLTLAATFAAMSIVIGIFCKNFLNFGGGLFRVTFENFPIVLSGVLFGPLVGAMVGAVSDIVSYCLSTQSLAISPLVTLGAAALGAAAGCAALLLRRASFAIRGVAAEIAGHLVGSWIIKTAALYVYYGPAVFWRLPVGIGVCALECVLVVLLFKNRAIGKLLEEISTVRRAGKRDAAGREETL